VFCHLPFEHIARLHFLSIPEKNVTGHRKGLPTAAIVVRMKTNPVCFLKKASGQGLFPQVFFADQREVFDFDDLL
jgi:hypothetical protein